MTIHLILWGVNKVSQGLQGSVHSILLDCLGALDKVENLPPYPIPSQCSHSNILKNTMIYCSNVSFTQIFSHLKVQQDDHTGYESLTCSTQLNCHCQRSEMDYHAKRRPFGTLVAIPTLLLGDSPWNPCAYSLGEIN
jgi:hypothetical protein